MNRLTLASMTCICLMGIVACSKTNDSKKPSTEKRPSNIISTQVKMGALPHEINAIGHAEALQTVEVRPQITAQIAQIQNINPESVRMSKHRLRAKLNLPSDLDMDEFLQSF